MPTPLEGIKVLDLSRLVAGPYAGRLLSDLGADVVKVEPPEGDVVRIWGEQRHGISGFYTQQNAGKRNVGIDLRVDHAPDVLIALAQHADVMVENFRPGVLKRLKIGWDVLHAANPRLILLSVSGFGQEGPESGRKSYAPIVHAESGLIERQAAWDHARPTDPVLSIADYNSALHGLVAVLAALHLRHTTGTGQWIDMAMIDAMLATDDYAHHALDGSPLERLGGELWDAPGGPIMVGGVLKNTWKVLSTTFGIADPSPPGADLDTKIKSRKVAVDKWFATFTDRDAVKAALEKAGLAWADIHTSTEAHDAHPRSFAMVDDRGGGQRRVVQSPYHFSDATSGVTKGAPYLGEHNAEVLSEWLGWPADRIAELTDQGILIAEGPGSG